MSDELTVSCSLSFTKGSTGPIAMSLSDKFDVSGTVYQQGRQEVGTSEEVINTGDVGSSEGWCIIINRDTTNFVELRQGAEATYTNAFATLEAGEFAMFRCGASCTLYGKADTAACEVEYILIAD